MKDWLLLSILCSFIFAMAAQAAPNDVMTAELHLINNTKVDVRDCAIFMPNLGSETAQVVSNLKKLGYSAQVVNDIKVEKLAFKDSNGHSVDEFVTHFNKKVGYYGKNTLLLSVKGYELDRSKKRVFILKLHRLGAEEAEVASSSFIGILNERRFSVKDLPRCQPKRLYSILGNAQEVVSQVAE